MPLLTSLARGKEKKYKKIQYFIAKFKVRIQERKKLTLLNNLNSKAGSLRGGVGIELGALESDSGMEPCPVGQGAMHIERLVHYL